MDAQTVLEIKPALTRYLHEFDDCFGRCTTRRHLGTYVQGQLGDLPRKSVEPIADAAGTPPRTLQEFLSLFRWDEAAVRARLQQRVARRHGGPNSVGVIDETSFIKKGDKTACVQRQHCGAAGKIDNCVVSVHLGYATPDPRGFHTLLDGELYLPEHTWHDHRHRCRAAGIPDEVVYRPKWRIALAQVRRALSNGVRFAWLTFDEGYGGKPPFLRELEALGQNYVAEVPSNTHVWTRAPAVLYRDHARDRKSGRPRKYPRLKVKNNPTAEVRHLLHHSPAMARTPWQRYHVKDGTKGPMVWEAKRITVWCKDEHGLPSAPRHLLVTRPVLNPDDVKYFISNASPQTTTETLLLVAFSRWKIERLFQDTKDELGMDHFEVRRWQSIHRHLLLSCVSHLFLAEFHQTHHSGGGGKKSGSDNQPGVHGDERPGTTLGVWRPLLAETGGSDQRANRDNTTAKRQSQQEPPKDNDQEITRKRRLVEEREEMSLAQNIAL